MTLAGTPTAVESDGRSVMTTAPGPDDGPIAHCAALAHDRTAADDDRRRPARPHR